MTDAPDLLPCPFCGASDKSDVFVERHADEISWEVSCNATDCLAAGPLRKTRREAVTAWNTRTPDPRIAEMEAALAKADRNRLTALNVAAAEDDHAEILRLRAATDDVANAIAAAQEDGQADENAR